MPIYSASVTSGDEFTGASAATGLFDGAVHTGGANIQVRVNSIAFSTGGTITDWTLNLIDPGDSHTTLLLTDTTADLATGGPSGFMLLPTNDDGNAWQLQFITTGMDSAATLKIDYDFENTPG